MKNNIVNSDYINNIIFIVLLLVVVLIVCFKSISIHKNIIENFAEIDNMEKEMDNAMGSNNDDASMTEDLDEMMNNLGDIYNDNNDSNDTEEDSSKKCDNADNGVVGSVTSKYSGKTINVDVLPAVKGSKRKYLIKWQPLGGKPGGCITANADGTYSTPICNTNINKQQWNIKEIKNAEEYIKIIPTDRKKMGRSMDETDFPFHIIQSVEYVNYCLHYEGGGLAIREIANYEAQKWDVSKEKIEQDPMPTQENSKFSSLTPGHKLSNADKSLGSVGEGGGVSAGGGDPMQFNINIDPDLLGKLGIDTGLLGNGGNGNGQGISGGSGNGGSGRGGSGGGGNGRGSSGGDLLLTEEEQQARKLARNRDNSDMMVDYNGNEELCTNCGKIPDNMIKKDLVKSMCIGCNNIDNVLT